MALKEKWIDKINGVDENSAEDINQVAHAVIDLENSVSKVTAVDDTLTVAGAAADAKAVGDKVGELSEDIDAQTDYVTFCYNARFARNKAIATGAIDVGAALELQAYESAWSHAVIECSDGDVFDVDVYGNETARAWCFIDVNNVILTRSLAFTGEEKARITAPTNAKRLIINTNFTEFPHSTVVKISKRELEVDKSLGSIAFNMLSLEGGSIEPNGALTESNNRIRTADYIYGNFTINCPDGVLCRYIVYYDKETKLFDSYEISDSGLITVGKDGCVAKLSFKRSDDSELSVADIDGRDVDSRVDKLKFEMLLLENGSIDSNGSLSKSNERIRTIEYLRGQHKIKCPDGIVCRFIIYYNENTLEFDSVLSSNSDCFTVGKDGCVAKLTFMRSDGGEIYAEDLQDVSVGKTVQSLGMTSPYRRDRNFGIVPAEYYKGLGDSYEDGFSKETDYATFINKWKSLVYGHTSYVTYVTETELGVASDGQKVYMYDFKPTRISYAQKEIPKIIIVGCQHGFEKSSVYGLYYFVKNLLTKWVDSPVLSYLRNHVELMIVPVLNTYGFNNRTYKNANGVNLNRNYDCNWQLLTDTSSEQYGGTSPFDQPESAMIRDLVMANKDAVLVVDFHTNGDGAVSNYNDITFYGFTPSDEHYYNRMLDVFDCHISDISAHFNVEYSLDQPDTIFGRVIVEIGTGQMRGWVTDNNIIGIVAEGFNGFPGSDSFTPDVYKANEEIIVNLIVKSMRYLM